MCHQKKKKTKEARVSFEDSEPVLQSWPDFWNPMLELFFHADESIGR